MAKVHASIAVNAAPDAVWAVVGSPDSLSEWHPAIAASPVSDGVRQTTIEGGGSLVEPIVEHSDDNRYYIYEITESPFPMSSYRSRIAVEDAAGSSRVLWETDFEPDDPATEAEMTATFTSIYEAGLEVVRDRFKG